MHSKDDNLVESLKVEKKIRRKFGNWEKTVRKNAESTQESGAQKTDLDEIDIRILEMLQRDGRMTNAELAERVGLAPSTSIVRVRNLINRGVITGFCAVVDPAVLGFQLQVLVSVTVSAGARQQMSELETTLRQAPGVLQLFFVGGVEDFIIHLAARDSQEVREFIEFLSAHPAVSTTRTSIIFKQSKKPL